MLIFFFERASSSFVPPSVLERKKKVIFGLGRSLFLAPCATVPFPVKMPEDHQHEMA
jgi:hypothetical protein